MKRTSETMCETTKACPACGETIKEIARKCRFCNEDIQKFEENLAAREEKEIFTGRPAVIYSLPQWFWVFVTVGLATIIYWFQSISTKYEITTQRLKIETGIFSKTKHNVELFRIDDFDLIHPFTMRILGYGILQVRSSDRNVPNLSIHGVKNIDFLYEQLQECSLKERERRGIKIWANA